jgi:hypothetical protein
MSFEIREDAACVECPEFDNGEVTPIRIEARRGEDTCLNLRFMWGDEMERQYEFGIHPEFIEAFINAVRWAAAGELGRLAIEAENV